MAQNEWLDIGGSEEVPENQPVARALDSGDTVLLYRHDGTLRAWSDACPHIGCNISKGPVYGSTAVCPCHNARFDLTNGRALCAPSLDDLPSYDVKEKDGRIMIGEPREQPIIRPQGSDDRTFLVAGGGAAGGAAVEQLRREGFAGRIVMITPEPHYPYDRTMLSKMYLYSDMSIDDVIIRQRDFYERLGVEVWKGYRVVRVEEDPPAVILDNDSRVQADALLLATGARPRTLPVEGAHVPGVNLLRTPEDANRIRSEAVESKNVVVVGGSFIGTEVAAALRQMNLNVRLVAMEETPLESVFGSAVGTRFAELHESHGVHLHMGTRVTRINGAKRVERVDLEDGTSLPADLVVLGVGVDPVVDYLDATSLVRNGAVPVNRHLESGVKGIFAAGDIADVGDGTQRVRVEHWVAAQRQGQHAARSMLGNTDPLPYAPFFWTMQYETPFVFIGYAPDYDEIRFRGDVVAGDFLAGYFKGGSLAAVAAMGRTGEAVSFGRRLDRADKIAPDAFDAA
ncbi:MAG: FAD-dependent oxidoreductase [Spirochaetota bacterium]